MLLVVADNKLFQSPGVSAVCKDGSVRPKGGNLLPPGVYKGGVIPVGFPPPPLVWLLLTREILGIWRLCLFDLEGPLIPFP